MENISLRKLVDNNGVLVIPDNVTSIKNRSLSLMPELKELVIGKNVRDIEAYAFLECYNLKKVTILSKEVVIYPNAFKDCVQLGKLSLPKTIEKLGKNFIGGVKEDLEILYDGTIEEWNNLVKDRNVCVSHQSQNDFHYYGDDVDKYVPDVWEKEIVIPEGFKYKLTVKK